jgi:hypothetical protein
MGLLDDAIREHLELKRRRGGDAGEIERQEHEALGPVRRTVRGEDGERREAPLAEEEDMPVAEEVAPAPVEYEEPPEGGEVEVVPADEEPLPDEGPASPVLADFGSDFEDSDVLPPDDPRRAVADVAQPTEEWGFEDEEEEEEPEPEEDPLEDTPDFLQETPEHDRLWFEQKPPKDFDFDQ